MPPDEKRHDYANLNTQVKVMDNTLKLGFKALEDKLDTRFEADDKRFSELFKGYNKLMSIITQVKFQWFVLAFLLGILGRLAKWY